MDQPPKSDLEKEPEVVEVSQFDVWKVVKPGTIGATTALGSCFGIIIYSPKDKRAIVGHFVSPKDTEDFENMLNEAKKLFKSLGHLRVYVGGNTPDLDSLPDLKDDEEIRKFVGDQNLDFLSEFKTYNRDNRKFVENRLREGGFGLVKISYAQPLESTILRIDTRNGAVEYLPEEDWKMDK